MAQSLPHPFAMMGGIPIIRVAAAPAEIGICRMGASDQMVALEQQLRRYEEELARLRVENEQLRCSSQAFGELAERLSVALQTATRVNRRATAADTGSPRRIHLES
jgi:hypothetical protein